MKVVIDIPEDVFDEIYTRNYYSIRGKEALRVAVRNGTPLPDGHGRLIDADKTIAAAWTTFYAHEDEWEKKDRDYVPFGRFYDQNGFECCQQTIVNAPTIIEADKGGEQE